MTHAAATRERALAAYQEGMAIVAIEQQCGVAAGVVRYWRQRLGIKNRSLPLGSRHRKVCRDRLHALHAGGLSDWRIAQELGVAPSSVTKARHAMGLRANFAVGRPAPARTVSRERVRELHDLGLSETAIANIMGVALSSIQRVRKELGLQPSFPQGWQLGNRFGVVAAALALLLVAGAAQAQGWQQHPAANEADPFTRMTHDGFGGAQIGCCHSQHCAYTEECAVPGGGFGVIGPDQLCHPVGDTAQHTHNCPAGQTSACFMDSVAGLQIMCSCLGAI